MDIINDTLALDQRFGITRTNLLPLRASDTEQFYLEHALDNTHRNVCTTLEVLGTALLHFSYTTYYQ